MSTILVNAWVEITDPHTNDIFYANPQTGECAWEKPSSSLLHQKDPTGEWWELWDDNHQLPYYYHTASGQTEWIRPETGTIIPLTKIQKSSIGKRISIALTPSDDEIDINQLQQINGLRHANTISPERSSGMLSINYVLSKQTSVSSNFSPPPLLKLSTSNKEDSLETLLSENSVDMGSSNKNISRLNSLNDSSKESSENSINEDFTGSSSQSSPNDKYIASNSSDIHSQDGEVVPLKRKTKISQSSIDSTMSASTASTSRPKTPNSGNTSNGGNQLMPKIPNSGNTSNGGNQLFKIMTPKKSTEVAERARKAGISNPLGINYDAAAAMRPTGTYRDLEKKRSGYKIHTRKLSTGEVMTLPAELQQDINKFRIDGFARKYFNTHKKGIFRRKVPVEKMLKFQKDGLKQPLMVLNPNIQKDAIKCFKTIQRIMGDRSKGRSGSSNVLENIQWLLDCGILHGELRDEIYVQIYSIRKGWELLSVVTVTFPPSKNFEAYLLNFISENFNVQENQIDVLSKHVHSRLVRICKRGPRGKVLTLGEIERAREAPFHPSLFGETLDFVMKLKLQRESYPNLKLPCILPFLANAILELKGQASEGIFRVPGDADYKLRIENNRFDIAGITDANVPSSLFKFWLRDLADPLIPSEFYNQCIQNCENVELSIEIIKNLPEINRRVVLFVIDFLQVFTKPHITKLTKMNVNNLAMVFAPNFLRCPSDNLAVIFENTKYEQTYVRTLLLNLHSREIESDLEYINVDDV
ncbi:10944_t:CDS:10 [Dentiscutata erythropus]|uniref:10944_t:CDS:1 n=1 Tax=Dentiscutata erythropus TaxID=1348616 RepID=A0A9N9BF14_9GLOM|nr:10944_t:CDS:10 [Dentiscutata erythropus]